MYLKKTSFLIVYICSFWKGILNSISVSLKRWTPFIAPNLFWTTLFVTLVCLKRGVWLVNVYRCGYCSRIWSRTPRACIGFLLERWDLGSRGVNVSVIQKYRRVIQKHPLGERSCRSTVTYGFNKHAVRYKTGPRIVIRVPSFKKSWLLFQYESHRLSC